MPCHDTLILIEYVFIRAKGVRPDAKQNIRLHSITSILDTDVPPDMVSSLKNTHEWPNPDVDGAQIKVVVVMNLHGFTWRSTKREFPKSDEGSPSLVKVVSMDKGLYKSLPGAGARGVAFRGQLAQEFGGTFRIVSVSILSGEPLLILPFYSPP